MKHRGGFTLVEVVLALVLMATLVVALFAFLFDHLDARERARALVARHRAATFLFDRLELDLTTCIVGDSHVGPGVHGDGSSLDVLSRSVAISLAEHGPGDPMILSDLQQSQYRFDEQAGSMELRHAPVGEASIFEDLGSTWYRLRFRYHDGNGWKDEFDSLDADQLPVAIEVMVWFNPWPGEEPMDVFEAPEESERLTFDDRGGFDEFDAAFETDIAEFAGEPLPDRIRVFLIPDADASEQGVAPLDDALAGGMNGEGR